jgi:hypothetical protein
MDLRDRESFSTIIKGLQEVPSSAYTRAAEEIRMAAGRDAQLDREILATSCAIKVSESTQRVASLGSWTDGVCRLHVFETANEADEKCLRIDAAELRGYHMSDFVNRIDVKFAPSTETVTWTRSSSVACDGITITRQGWKSAEIFVHVDYENGLLAVPPELGGHDVQFCNVTNMFKLICHYIKKHELSSDDDPSYFTPDSVLHKLLYPNHPHNHPVSFASLLDVIKNHFKRPGPFRIDFGAGSQEKVFEIVVQIAKRVDGRLSDLVGENERKLEIELLKVDEEIALLGKDLEPLACDTLFLNKLISNPIGYLCDILEMPTGVMKNVESSGKIDYTQMGTSYEFYKQPWAIGAAAFVVNDGSTGDGGTHEQTTKSSRRR